MCSIAFDIRYVEVELTHNMRVDRYYSVWPRSGERMFFDQEVGYTSEDGREIPPGLFAGFEGYVCVSCQTGFESWDEAQEHCWPDDEDDDGHGETTHKQNPVFGY